MEKTIELRVHIAQDAESGRWYIAESDIPGLRLEADDALTLIERVRVAAPEMIELNEAEIAAKHSGDVDHKLTAADIAKLRHGITPVFDSPLDLAFA